MRKLETTHPELLNLRQELKSSLPNTEIKIGRIQNQHLIGKLKDDLKISRNHMGFTKLEDPQLGQIYSLSVGESANTPMIFNSQTGNFESLKDHMTNGKVIVTSGSRIQLYKDGPEIVLPFNENAHTKVRGSANIILAQERPDLYGISIDETKMISTSKAERLADLISSLESGKAQTTNDIAASLSTDGEHRIKIGRRHQPEILTEADIVSGISREHCEIVKLQRERNGTFYYVFNLSETGKTSVTNKISQVTNSAVNVPQLAFPGDTIGIGKNGDELKIVLPE